jgi:hypothetical protein
MSLRGSSVRNTALTAVLWLSGVLRAAPLVAVPGPALVLKPVLEYPQVGVLVLLPAFAARHLGMADDKGFSHDHQATAPHAHNHVMQSVDY